MIIRSDGSLGIFVSTELDGLTEAPKEVTLLLLHEVEGSAVLAEAGLDARLLILAQARSTTDFEVNTKVPAESMLSCDRGVVLPVFVILGESALEDGVGHLNGADGLVGVDLELVAWLSHLFLRFLIL